MSPHEDLLKLLARHRNNRSKRPIAKHTALAFEQVITWLINWGGDVILDACCGVGESTARLSQQFPNARIIGIDKSSARLDKHAHYAQSASVQSQSVSGNSATSASNYMVLQADLNDFWRLLSAYINDGNTIPTWRLSKQFILYPNPYPKKAQLGKRWHASPAFPSMIDCCKDIEVRSNWRIYVEEFVQSAAYYDVYMEIREHKVLLPIHAMTPFERKYAQAGQTLWSAITLGTGRDK